MENVIADPDGYLTQDGVDVIVCRDDEFEANTVTEALQMRLGLLMGDRFVPFPGVRIELLD